MLNRGTLLLLVSAIALGGGVLLFENRGGSDRSNSVEEAQGEPLLPFEESAITQFTLNRADAGDLSFVRDESRTWQMSQPEDKTAESGAIAFLLSQLARPSSRVVTVDSNSLGDFGLDNPEATITLEAEDSAEDSKADQSIYRIIVGNASFGGDQRYVQVIDLTGKSDGDTSEATEAPSAPSTSDQADASQIEIHLVSGGIVDAIKRPTAEWLVVEETNPSSSEAKSSEAEGDEAVSKETASDEKATD